MILKYDKQTLPNNINSTNDIKVLGTPDKKL